MNGTDEFVHGAYDMKPEQEEMALPVKGEGERITVERGIVLGLPAEDYHAMPAISSGGLKMLLKSPAHFMHHKKAARDPSRHMNWGTVLHTAVLEPHRLREVVAVMPADAPDRRSKAGRAWHEEFGAAHAGCIIIDAERWERIEEMARNVLATDPAAEFLVDGDVESTILWKEGDIACRARPDFLHRDRTVVVDIKTATDASPEGFAKACWNYRYDIQAAWYLDGITMALDFMPVHWLWCVIESEQPHAVAWYRAEPDVIEIGRRDFTRALDIYRRCVTRNEWPGYDPRIRPLSLPRWARVFDAGKWDQSYAD